MLRRNRTDTGIICDNQITRINLNAVQDNRSIDLHRFDTAFSSLWCHATAPGRNAIFSNFTHIAYRAIDYNTFQTTCFCRYEGLSSHAAHIGHSTGISDQDITRLCQIIYLSRCHFDKIMVYQTLCSCFLNRNTAKCHCCSDNHMSRFNRF